MRAFRNHKINLAFALTLSASICLPHMVWANGAECVATVSPHAAAEEAVVMDFGDLFEVDNSIATAISNLEIRKTALPAPLGLKDPDKVRLAKNTQIAKAALARVMKEETDPQKFQGAVDAFAKYINGSLSVKEAESLEASKLLDTKMAEARKFDEVQIKVEGSMDEMLRQFRNLNPDVADVYKPETYSLLSKLPVFGKKAEKSAADKANTMYERVTNYRQGILDAIGGVKAGGVDVKAHLEQLKIDRVALIKLMAAYEQRTAMLIALDHVIYEFLATETKETDATREFFTQQLIKPIRQVMLDIEAMKDSVNTALLMNFALVERGEDLVNRTGRMADRLTVDFFTAFITKIAISQQARQAKVLNSAEMVSAEMKAQVAESFRQLGIEIRNEENVLDTVTTMIREKNEKMTTEIKDAAAYNARMTDKLASLIQERAKENGILKANVLKMETGERLRGGAAADATTLAEALRTSVMDRQEANQELKDTAKIK